MMPALTWSRMRLLRVEGSSAGGRGRNDGMSTGVGVGISGRKGIVAMGAGALAGGVVSLGLEVVCVPSCRSGTAGREDVVDACAEARVARWTWVGGSRLGVGTVVTFAVGGGVPVEGDFGIGGDSVTAVTGVGGLGLGVRPEGSGVGLELELLLRGLGDELAVDGEVGGGGESGTGCTRVDGLGGGGGLRPLEADLDLDLDLELELLLRGRAMMRIDA